MVTPVFLGRQIALAINSPAKLASPDHECFIEQSTLTQISQQCGLRLIDILALQWSDNVKAWVLEPHGAYVRVQPKAGAPLVRSQQKFIEQTRDKVKVADQAARPLSRFHVNPTAQKSPLEGKVPRAQRRRPRREER